MKKFIIFVSVVILIGAGFYWLIKGTYDEDVVNQEVATTDQLGTDQASTTPVINKEKTVIGKSAEGRDIVAYHFGTGSSEILFVGGIHGGYSWNTALVAQETANYLKANPTIIATSTRVTVIPVLNPDGLNKVVGTSTAQFIKGDVASSQAVQVSGRFNANTVDLNRNFDCDWQTDGKWQNKTVSGGSAAFSEPESQAIKNYVETQKPKAVVVWYSAAGGVYASNCHSDVLPETSVLTNLFAEASGYRAYEDFDFYETTGDMVNWLAKKGIPAISVLLTNHTDIEWTKNQAGVKAVIEHYNAK